MHVFDEPSQLWDWHKKDRKARRVKPLCLTAFRNALCGCTYTQLTENRGRKRSLGPRAVDALNEKRCELVKKLLVSTKLAGMRLSIKPRQKRQNSQGPVFTRSVYTDRHTDRHTDRCKNCTDHTDREGSVLR